MTNKKAIHDLISIKDYFESESDASPVCLTYAIEELTKAESKKTFVLKLKAEIKEEISDHVGAGDYDVAYGLKLALNIINKCKAESEKA